MTHSVHVAAPRTFTLISAHFGDFFWIEELARRVNEFAPTAAVPELIPINQDRSLSSRDRLARLPRVKRVLEFPVCADEVAIQGHDHPSALNRVMCLPVDTSHIIILDSDCFPFRPDWLARIGSLLDEYDAIVAADPFRRGLSHPCFMVLPLAARSTVDFAEGLKEVGMDTGRLVGLQLVRAGYRTHFDQSEPGFRRRRGYFYLEGSLYHHGSASFASSLSPEVRSQVQAPIEAFYQRKVRRGDFDLGWSDLAYLRLITLYRKIAERF
jgi:hypothetical protein